MNWDRKIKYIWEDWYCGPYKVYKKTFNGPWHLTYNNELIATWSDLQEIMEEAELHKKRVENE